MGVRVSGGTFSALGIGLNWERTDGDEAVAPINGRFWKIGGCSSGTATLRTRSTAWRQRSLPDSS